MQFTKRGIIITAVVVIVLAFGWLFVLNRSNDNNPTPFSPSAGNDSISLPETVFDEAHPLGDSGITVKYPSNGFYGLGANVSEKSAELNLVGGVHVETAAPFEASRTAEFVTMDVSLSKTDAGSLEEIVEAIPPQSYDGQYAALNGTYVSVNGYRYFVYRVTEDVTVQIAFGLDGEHRIGVSLAYKRGDDPESLAAYQHNDELFMELLSNITYQ